MYPAARIVPEAFYHAAFSRDRLGDAEGADKIWLDLTERFPESQWAAEAELRRFERQLN